MTGLLEARTSAQAASERAGVVVRAATDNDELAGIEALLVHVWQHPPGAVEVDVSMLAALARTGNYVAGAFRGDELVGASVGFRCEPFPGTLYSHVTGVDRDRAAAGTGTALKLYQRAWCLERGITAVRWTFDPLQARNARLNIHRLGARPIEFSPDYYGPLRDGLNSGSGSDRLIVQWDLDRESERADLAVGREVPAVLHPGLGAEPERTELPHTGACLVTIPGEIDRLRADDPELAGRWRQAVSTVLAELLSRGWVIDDFAESSYVLSHRIQQEA